MRRFRKGSKGSITVFVTWILIPTIFFTGFLVDLARLKLYGSQAVMTADNYGATVLSQYDNLLKELYGLFAVTQDKQALEDLEALQAYMKTSFDPTQNTVDVLNHGNYSGFMPYKSANVNLDYNLVQRSQLRNNAVLTTQIGDFMRFRIVQQVAGDGSKLMEPLEQVLGTESDAKAIEKKMELDEEAEKLFEAARNYYNELMDIMQYPQYIEDINSAYRKCKTTFKEIEESSSYKTYFAYETSDKESMEAAVDKRDEIEKAKKNSESTDKKLSSTEQALVDIYDAYQKDEEAREEKLKKKFNAAGDKVDAATKVDPINFDNFDSKVKELGKKAEKIVKMGDNLKTLRAQLRQLLTDESLTESLKEGIQADLERMEELFGQINYYLEIANYIKDNNTSVNDSYDTAVQNMLEQIKLSRDKYLACEEVDYSDWPDELDKRLWKNFQTNDNYKKLYESLKKCFGGEGDEDKGKKKKDDADKELKEAQDKVNNDETTTARNIPDTFDFGTSYTDTFELSDMASEAVGYYEVNSFTNNLNQLLLKFYTVQYDFGMFSSRITNINADKDANKDAQAQGTKTSGETTEEVEKDVSLTGYELCSKINYLYQAELEYLMGGSKNSVENLNATRNKILAVRGVSNYAATYAIKEVNSSIQGISNAAAVINPILGLAVNGALRLAVAGLETAWDWDELKKGESVVFLKTKLVDMTAYDKVVALIDYEKGKPEEKKGFSMNYEQYLMVGLVFLTSSDELSRRTADLIELNVNTVAQDIEQTGEELQQTFRMDKAYTAVDTTCSVHMDFVVMPKGFAKAVATDESYSQLEEFEKNSYKFTVTRGY